MPSEPADNLYVNALLGAVVTVVLSFTVFSPIAGGALAGYLERGDRNRGLKTGAVSGLFASIPLAFLGLAVLFFVPFAAGVVDGTALGFSLFAVVAVLLGVGFVAAFTVGLSALGGILGVALIESNDE